MKSTATTRGKVLVVDDEVGTRKIIVRALESRGFTTISAGDGKLGFEILEHNPDVNLIVTDMQMPGMDGREFITAVRSREELAHLPILIISGVISLNNITDLLKRGATRFMPKPLNLKELVDYSIGLTEH